MTADSAAARNPTASFQLKGGMITVTALNVLQDDLERFAKELAAKVRKNPGFFQGMPVVIDLQAMKSCAEDVDIPRIALLLGDQGMIPLGVRNCSEAQRQVAQDFGLALLPDTEGARPARSNPEPQTTQPKVATTRVISQPVRSGQQIYAEGGDLIVLSSVSPGAEILADGHIHVYGSLHGRALAGIQGDSEARIFCRKLFAELISIAGTYRVYEDMDSKLRGQAVQIYLQQQQLLTEPL